MNTKIITWNEERGFEADELAEAAQIIRDGGLVAFPTETVYGLGGNGLDPQASQKIYAAKGSKVHIVIDPGHGGFDPGKVGTMGTLEKDVNLNISLKLREILTKSGYTVAMTREKDEALCGETTGKK